MVYSTAYPLYVTLTGTSGTIIEYSLSIKGKNIFNGKVVLIENSAEINIMDKIRNYLETFYEDVIGNSVGLISLPVRNNIGSLIEATFSTASFTSTYKIAYDYNSNRIQELPNTRFLNEPIDRRVDPRQIIGISGYNIDSTYTYSSYINGVISASNSTNASDAIKWYKLDLSNLKLNVNDVVTLSGWGGSIEFRVIEPCSSRFAVYYVNKYGGLDSLICSGKATESYNTERTDVRLYTNNLHAASFEKKRIAQEITKKYALNTGLLTDAEGKRIDHLMSSPKIWLHDLESEDIISCMVDATSYQIKTSENDSLVSYSFNIYESKPYIRL